MKFFDIFISDGKVIFMLIKSHTLVYILLWVIMGTFTACANDNSPPDVRDKFVGSYDMSQLCDNQPNPDYRITISKSTQNEDEIILQNLGSYGNAVKGVVTGNDISVPSQEVGAGVIGMVTLSGSGTLDNNTMEIQLEVLVPSAGGTKTKSTCQISGEKV
jgi:hypothetical protein